MAEYKAKISCLASGNGTNLQSLIDSCASNEPGSIPGAIIKVTVNRKDAYALKRAEMAQPPIPTDYFNLVKHGFHAAGEKDAQKVKDARFKYDAALAERILADNPDLIVLAGWMHVMSAGFLNPVAAAGVPIINLHPALPGKYDGAGAIKRAYEDFKAGKLENGITGIMIHYVVEEVDRGAPILTQEVQIQDGESLEELEQRIHGYEHELIVKATALLAEKIVAAKRSRTS
ncbi:formyl transferase [Xylariaceae sp. FL1651]|nr:formyl transferase [Xylariaceae sp. FL1651]